jgi:Fe2+ transport protein
MMGERLGRLLTVRVLVGSAVALVVVVGSFAGYALTRPAGNGAAAATTPTLPSATAATGGKLPTPMRMLPLGHAVWQHMDIEARASAPVSFGVFTGTSERVIKVTKKDTMHLMVMLTDNRTDVAIPYASVWATIRRNGKVVFDERQWPMLSLYMGSHYGNNVALPGPGTYQLTLLITPPEAARHPEYEHVWLKPHRVTMTFHWPAS